MVLVRRSDPDLATLRDRAVKKPMKIIYGMLSMGWRGSARHWHRYQSAYLLLAGLATPLVLSVHSVISFDFSIAIVPGWHTTIFSAVFRSRRHLFWLRDGLTIAIPLRKAYGLEDFITMRHLDNMAKGHAGHRPHRCLWLLHGILHGLLQRQQV